MIRGTISWNEPGVNQKNPKCSKSEEPRIINAKRIKRIEVTPASKNRAKETTRKLREYRPRRYHDEKQRENA
jgi:hypothetical protein